MTVPATPPPEQKIGGNLYKLMATKLRRPPIEIIDEMRATTVRRGDGSTGPPSFRTIAEHLSQRARVDVSFESVRRWYLDAHPTEEDVA